MRSLINALPLSCLALCDILLSLDPLITRTDNNRHCLIMTELDTDFALTKCILLRCFLWVFTENHDDVIKWKHFSRYWALCTGSNPPVNGGFPSQRPVTRSFEVFFDLRLIKRLGKQSRRRWFSIIGVSGLWVDLQSGGDLVSQTSKVRILSSAKQLVGMVSLKTRGFLMNHCSTWRPIINVHVFCFICEELFSNFGEIIIACVNES